MFPSIEDRATQYYCLKRYKPFLCNWLMNNLQACTTLTNSKLIIQLVLEFCLSRLLTVCWSCNWPAFLEKLDHCERRESNVALFLVSFSIWFLLVSLMIHGGQYLGVK